MSEQDGVYFEGRQIGVKQSAAELLGADSMCRQLARLCCVVGCLMLASMQLGHTAP